MSLVAGLAASTWSHESVELSGCSKSSVPAMLLRRSTIASEEMSLQVLRLMQPPLPVSQQVRMWTQSSCNPLPLEHMVCLTAQLLQEPFAPFA